MMKDIIWFCSLLLVRKAKAFQEFSALACVYTCVRWDTKIVRSLWHLSRNSVCFQRHSLKSCSDEEGWWAAGPTRVSFSFSLKIIGCLMWRSYCGPINDREGVWTALCWFVSLGVKGCLGPGALVKWWDMSDDGVECQELERSTVNGKLWCWFHLKYFVKSSLVLPADLLCSALWFLIGGEERNRQSTEYWTQSTGSSPTVMLTVLWKQWCDLSDKTPIDETLS